MAKILIVDDSPTELCKMRAILEKQGHAIVAADNGKTGVTMAHAEQPDLILMDIVMPELNGFQATRQLSRSPGTAHIPVIMVTMKNQAADRVWGERQGAQAYLTKPLQGAELLETVNQLLNGRGTAT